MAYIPQALVNQEIDAGVERAMRALASTIVRIRYSIEEDWTDDPSIFFRIVLKDEAVKRQKLNELAETAMSVISREVNSDDLGLHAYFNFRTLSEQSQLNEPAWA